MKSIARKTCFETFARWARLHEKLRVEAFVVAFCCLFVSVGTAFAGYNSAQIQHMFSGSRYTATGACGTGDTLGDATMELQFDTQGKLQANWECKTSMLEYISSESVGWRAEDDRLCLDFPSDSKIAFYFPEDNTCFEVRRGRFYVETFSDGGVKVWSLGLVAHPMYSTTEEMFAEIRTVRRAAAAPARSSTVGPSNSLVSTLAKDLADWQAVKNSNQVKDFQKYIESHPSGQFLSLAQDNIKTLTKQQQFIARQQEEDDQSLWDRVRRSRDLNDVRRYLKRFPDGSHKTEALARVLVLEKLAAVADVEFGTYHALVIGIDSYKHLTKLNTAVNDARAVAEVLERDYGFQVVKLENPSRGDIIDTLDQLRERLSSKDNLVVYYAGHGWLDEEADRGYWLPVDAKPNRRSNWVSNATLTDTLRTLQAKHVMVIADSCFSGTLTRDAGISIKSGDYWRRMAEKQARVAITSGGLEPVADTSIGGEHSPFALALLSALKRNDAVLDGTSLFNAIRQPVVVATKQTPEYADVRNAGHEGGDFLFIRK